LTQAVQNKPTKTGKAVKENGSPRVSRGPNPVDALCYAKGSEISSISNYKKPPAKEEVRLRNAST